MGAHQIFFGALGFDSEDKLDRAIEEVFSPGVSGDAPALLRETVREARLGGRTLLVSFDADMPSSHWLRFTGAFAELGGRASRGHLTMLYDGDGIELVVAGAGRSERATLPAGSIETRRWLALRSSPVVVPWLGQPAPLEFDIVRRDDGTAALDTRDWMGLFGRLVERDETIFLEDETGAIHEWARPGEAGSTCVLARPDAELITVVEVIGRRPLETNGTTRTDTIEVLLHELVAWWDAEQYLRKDRPWRSRAHRMRRLWLASGEGLVAIDGR